MMDEKKTVALILAQLAEGEGIAVGIEPGDEEIELSPEEQLHAVAGELVAATKCGDVAAVAEALRGAFLLLDTLPHVEGKHLEEQEEEEEPEESSDPYETVSHELRERFGGYREEDEEESHSYGGRAGRRYAMGGKVRRYAAGGMVPGAMGRGAASDVDALTARAKATLGAAAMQRAGGMPASPGVVTSGPSTMDSRAALARALSRR